MSASPARSTTIVVICVPADAAAVRSLCQRLRLDGLTIWLAADELEDKRDRVRALRDVLRHAAVVLVCLSRRAVSADGQPDAGLTETLAQLSLLPGHYTPVALKLTSCPLPAALADAAVVELFGFSSYTHLRDLLRSQIHQVAAAPATAPEQSAGPQSPALLLRGRFGLPALERHGHLRRIGRGVARQLLFADERRALLVAGGGVTLIDMRDGAPIWSIDCPTRCAALGRSGALVALAAYDQITLWNLADGQPVISCTGGPAEIRALAFAPDERTLAAVASDGSLCLWRTTPGAGPAAPIARMAAHPDAALSIAFSPDGALLATGSADRSVRIWRTLDRALVRTLAGQGGAVEVLAFSADGALLAAGSRGRSARLWETRTWRTLHTLEPHGGAVEALAFSADGSMLATGSADQRTRLWRSVAGALAQVLEGHRASVAGLSFSPDGSALASLGGDERLLLWQSGTGALLADLRPLSGRVGAMAFSPDGALLAIAGGNGTLLLTEPAGSAPPQRRSHEHQGAILGVAVQPGGRIISTSADRTVRACTLDAPGPPTILFQTHGAHQPQALSADGRILASSDGDTTLQLWRLSGPADNPGGSFWRVLRGLRSRPRRIAFAPDGDAIAFVGDDGLLQCWHLTGPPDAGPFFQQPAAVGRVQSLAFGPSSALLAAGGDQSAVTLWNADGSPAGALTDLGATITALAFAPDGRALAAGDTNGRVTLWRLPLAAPRRRRPTTPANQIAGHSGPVEQLAFSPVGGLLASGGADGCVRVWRV